MKSQNGARRGLALGREWCHISVILVTLVGLFFMLDAATGTKVDVKEGPCPDRLKNLPQARFTYMPKYNGIWYNYKRLGKKSPDVKCVFMEVIWNSAFTANFTMYAVNVAGTPNLMEVNAMVISDYNLMNMEYDDKQAATKILGTDYEDMLILKIEYARYALLQSCIYDKKNNTHTEYAWLWTRKMKLDPKRIDDDEYTQERIELALNKTGFYDNEFVSVSLTRAGCEKYFDLKLNYTPYRKMFDPEY